MSICIPIECYSNMESSPRSSVASEQELCQLIATVINLESSKTGNRWVHISRLSELLYEQYGLYLGHPLKGFFTSRNFSIYTIYNGSRSDDFYVAFFPNYASSQTRKAKDVGNNLSQTQQNSKKTKPESSQADSHLIFKNQTISLNDIILPVDIKSAEDLKIALTKITKYIIINDPHQLVTVAKISQLFRTHYGKPIRPILRSFCPNERLIDIIDDIKMLLKKNGA